MRLLGGTDIQHNANRDGSPKFAQPVPVVRRGLRAETFVSTFKFKWSTPCRPGLVFGYLDPSNWWAVEIRSTDGKARIVQRTDDGPVNIIQTDTTALSLTNNTWYTAKVVVELQTSWPYANVLTMWVDTDNDADFSDETALLGGGVTGAVGYVGVYRGAEGATVQQFDDFKLGTNNSSPKDGDFLDAGDEIAIDDNFNSAAITLSYDNNGNLTDDGIFAFVYDAWNRLVKAKHRSASNAATIGTYAYDGAMRRTKKVVTNQGPEATANDGGDTTNITSYGLHFRSIGIQAEVDPWAVVEERNGASSTKRQYCNGTQYIDEHVWLESNADPTIGNNTSPDVLASGEGAESPSDLRVFFVQDRIWNVSAVTRYDTTGTSNAVLTSAYAYTPYGLSSVLEQPNDLGENQLRFQSESGNAFDFQGLCSDREWGGIHSRRSDISPYLGRFIRQDPLVLETRVYLDGHNLYLYLRNNPVANNDPLGLVCVVYMVCQPSCWMPLHCGYEYVWPGGGAATSTCHCDGFWCDTAIANIWCGCLCLGCATNTVPPGVNGPVCQTRLLPDSACNCLDANCGNFPRINCYNGINSNSNTGAYCLNKKCKMKFLDPWAPGWNSYAGCPPGY